MTQANALYLVKSQTTGDMLQLLAHLTSNL